MKVAGAGGRVDGVDLESMDASLVAALSCCTASGFRRVSSAVTGCLGVHFRVGAGLDMPRSEVISSAFE